MKVSKQFTAAVNKVSLPRRRFVTGMATVAAAAGLGCRLPSALAFVPAAPKVLSGQRFDLTIAHRHVNFTGNERVATVINGSLPAPILHWREGDSVTLRVTNHLAHDSSIHWHGMILPSGMDGVPGLSFDGIKPGETFEYRFDVNQSGTFWYHSHSDFQEQTGMYGAIVIDPRQTDPVSCDRDYVVLLSDWSDEAPDAIYAKLKKMSHYYNFRERTAVDLWNDIKAKGIAQTWKARAMWNRMRMSDRDISDVTGYTYTFLMNGVTPDPGWLGLFKRGERLRLRFINAAAMTIFDVRIPGLKMTVVAADGQAVHPFSVDEFRIGVAETYDVVVRPESDSAYTLFAQSIDRSGYARGTLASHPGQQAEIPDMDPAPVLSHRDMGMAHHADHDPHAALSAAENDHSRHEAGHAHGTRSDHHNMDHSRDHKPERLQGAAGFGSNSEIIHAATEFGPHVDMRADAPQNGLHDPGIGLRNHKRLYGRRVLTYADLCNYYPTRDRREPGREIQLHLTGNMSRYMWSIDGIRFADAEPLLLNYGERVRITLVNDTMMTHPVHLHGMWSELETGYPGYIPRKHTVLVQPGSKISYLVTADAKGRWAYHCHLLYHMPGMMREVRVS